MSLRERNTKAITVGSQMREAEEISVGLKMRDGKDISVSSKMRGAGEFRCDWRPAGGIWRVAARLHVRLHRYAPPSVGAASHARLRRSARLDASDPLRPARATGKRYPPAADKPPGPETAPKLPRSAQRLRSTRTGGFTDEPR